jgi:hypothetical protein
MAPCTVGIAAQNGQLVVRDQVTTTLGCRTVWRSADRHTEADPDRVGKRAGFVCSSYVWS